MNTLITFHTPLTYHTQRYVIALCSPEIRVEACRHPSFAQFLFNDGQKMRRQLERENQAVISPGADGLILIQGAETDVYGARDKLLSLMNTSCNGHSLNYPPTTVATSAQPTPTGQEILPDAQIAAKPLHGARYNSVISRGGSDFGHEKRVQYFMELGFTREMVENILMSLADAPDDVILNRLVQCTPSQRSPRGDEPLPVRPVNPELLRHIVIDGSNVAMK